MKTDTITIDRADTGALSAGVCYVACVPDVAPLSRALRDVLGRCWSVMGTDTQDNNRRIFRKMNKQQRLDWIRGLVRQVQDNPDYTFWSDVTSAMIDCGILDVTPCQPVSSKDPRWCRRKFTCVGFRAVTLEDYDFVSPDDWAWRFLKKLGAYP